MKKILATVGVIIGTILGVGLVVGSKWPRINDVATGRTPEYPDLHAQHFDQPYDMVFDTCVDTATALGLDVTSSDRESGVIEAIATTKIMRFKDDVTIRLSPRLRSAPDWRAGRRRPPVWRRNSGPVRLSRRLPSWCRWPRERRGATSSSRTRGGECSRASSDPGGEMGGGSSRASASL